MTDDQDRTDLTPTERRLRAALSARATSIQPSTDGLDRIEEKIMEEPTPSGNRRWIYGAVSAAAVVILVVIGLFVFGDDDDETGVVAEETTSTTTSTSTSTSTSTTAATTTSTEAFTPDVDPFSVAYPGPTTSQRFESPEPAAESYAREVLGFTELELGEFLAGDSRSGEIEITDRPGGPVTVVLLRLMDDETWFVLGSHTADITVDTPEARDSLSSPFETSGSALAFEGNVTVLVRSQNDPVPLGEGFVTGSGSPPAGPFEGSIEFTPPGEETPGIVIYRTHSAEDGRVQQAVSFPVRLLPS